LKPCKSTWPETTANKHKKLNKKNCIKKTNKSYSHSNPLYYIPHFLHSNFQKQIINLNIKI
jgi:hypothetical protein